MKAIRRTDPTGESMQNMLQASGGTGTYGKTTVVRIPLATTSTAAGATNWINPEAGTVVTKAFVVFTTAGTGTFNIGRGSDGTGSATNLINAGTMTVGVHYAQEILGTVAASATVGGIDLLYILVGPGGTGTNNSLNMTHSDTITSTAAGALLVEYFLIAPVVG